MVVVTVVVLLDLFCCWCLGCAVVGVMFDVMVVAVVVRQCNRDLGGVCGGDDDVCVGTILLDLAVAVWFC